MGGVGEGGVRLTAEAVLEVLVLPTRALACCAASSPCPTPHLLS